MSDPEDILPYVNRIPPQKQMRFAFIWFSRFWKFENSRYVL